MKLKDASVGPRRHGKGLGQHNVLSTQWTAAAMAGETWQEYPRPAMVREGWINLNGLWDYAFLPRHMGEKEPADWDGKILVPFSPESRLSGVERQLQPDEYLWYRRTVELPVPEKGKHYLLHFGAVDQECTVYADGIEIGRHSGGYLPFALDLSDVGEAFVLTVRVSDVSDTSYHARGKQKLARGGMYYTAVSGIWQTVWAEAVPDAYISQVCCDPDPDEKCCRLTISMAGTRADTLVREISHEEPHLWTPEDPYLYRVVVREGEDSVEVYYAMRTWKIGKTRDGHLRFFLNGQPRILTGVLDQGYWPEGILTPPSDEAMISDITSMKKLGFDLLRKHIKLEPQRWYYHCDRLGMIVWQDLVNGGSSYKDWFVTYAATVLNIRHISVPDNLLTRRLLSRSSSEGRAEFLRESEETITRLRVHPSIACWVAFNEGWGQFDSCKMAENIRKWDPSRLIDHASGWFDRGAGDVLSLHHYFFKLHFRPDNHRVLALTEYGGYTLKLPGHSWSADLYGYGKFTDRASLTEAYCELMNTEVLSNIPKGISAFVYTQLSDIEDEENGILTYDRKECKLDADRVRDCNRRVHEQIRLCD